MLRRSDFIVARYAFSFVLANFGIAIAARMPMMTTTIRSSIRVKPFLVRAIVESPKDWKKLERNCAGGPASGLVKAAAGPRPAVFAKMLRHNDLSFRV